MSRGEKAVEVVGHLMEEQTDLYPHRWRVQEFPIQAELAELAELAD